MRLCALKWKRIVAGKYGSQNTELCAPTTRPAARCASSARMPASGEPKRSRFSENPSRFASDL
jgi:hypothetical protein